MSQPPGPYGGQYGAPAPYGQPGPAQYGQPAGYGPPGGGYGPPGPGGYGQPPQQKKSGALPWLIATLVVVLIGAGVLTFFLLKDDDDDSNTASTATPSISAQEMGSDMSGADVDPDIDLPTGAEVPVDEPMEPPTSSGGDTGEETITGSVDLAAAWLVAVAQGDVDTAWSLTDASLQTSATDAAAGSDATPQEFLVGYFYSEVLQSEEPTEAELVSVEYDSASASDVVVIDVTLSGGGSVQVVIFVNESLLVQDFGTL